MILSSKAHKIKTKCKISYGDWNNMFLWWHNSTWLGGWTSNGRILGKTRRNRNRRNLNKVFHFFFFFFFFVFFCFFGSSSLPKIQNPRSIYQTWGENFKNGIVGHLFSFSSQYFQFGRTEFNQWKFKDRSYLFFPHTPFNWNEDRIT